MYTTTSFLPPMTFWASFLGNPSWPKSAIMVWVVDGVPWHYDLPDRYGEAMMGASNHHGHLGWAHLGSGEAGAVLTTHPTSPPSCTRIRMVSLICFQGIQSKWEVFCSGLSCKIPRIFLGLLTFAPHVDVHLLACPYICSRDHVVRPVDIITQHTCTAN